MSAIYLDFNATTPILREVAEKMAPFLYGKFGNPSSTHEFGLEAKMALEAARVQVAEAIGADRSEIVFTSGGTESNNLAIKGLAWARRGEGYHILTTAVEHPAVSEVCRSLEREGFKVTTLEVDENGLVDLEEFEQALRPETILVTAMLANNEIGTMLAIREMATIAHRHGVAIHTDAAQAIGKIPVDVRELGVDLLSVAGHKLYAPKGVGALFIREGVDLVNVLHGADHEHGRRPGTENVLLAVGLGQASEAARRELLENMAHMAKLRNRLEEGLMARVGEEQMRINARNVERLPNTTSVSFQGIDAGAMLAEIGHRVAASAGAACHAETVEMSPVLEAIGLSKEWAMGTIRLSGGRETTAEEIDEVVEVIAETVERLRPKLITKLPASGADDSVRLTRFTKGMGCACKIRPQLLEGILRTLPKPDDARVLVDMTDSDDAAVYQIADRVALVQTVDFLTPIVDDPYQFGMIAAANSLSDVYAMGATPLFALNLVAFPSARLPAATLHEILKGAAEKCLEAGVSVLGGHSIDDPEPKFGMVVSGTAELGEIWTNAAAMPGDVLILTKPIGTGLIATGLKLGVTSNSDAETSAESMATLNAAAAASIRGLSVKACTDVTGFGLLGHTCEILAASGVDAEITASRVPVLPGAAALADGEIIPGGTRANLEYVKDRVRFEAGVGSARRMILADAQTSGGLLVAISEERAETALGLLRAAGVKHAQIIGRITRKGSGHLAVGP